MARPNRDAAHLRRLRDTYARLGCLPSYKQLAEELGFEAKNAAFKLCQRLIAAEYLSKSAGGRLIPGQRFFTLDASDDEVRAGFGAEGNATGVTQAQAMDQLLATKPSKTVLVKVRGDSMVNVGVLSGDVAVVETGTQAIHGDIVVAEIDGSHTIKEFRMSDGRPCLAGHGPGASVVAPRRTLNVIGVVRGVVRSYKPLVAGKRILERGASR